MVEDDSDLRSNAQHRILWHSASLVVRLLIPAGCALLPSIHTAARADVYWQVQSGDWFFAPNWGGTLPIAGANAYVANGGSVTIAQPGAACYILRLGSNLASGAVVMTQGGLSTSGAAIGDSGIGNFSLSGGTHATLNYLSLGEQVDGKGTYSLTGTGALTAYGVTVGYLGTGTFIQSGGTSTISGILGLGSRAGSSGVYNLSATGQLSTKNATIGVSGTGTFTLSGGTHTVSDVLTVGGSSGGNGLYNLNGGQLSAGVERVGAAGTGVFTHRGGTNNVNGTLTLSGADGRYNLSDTGVLTAQVVVVDSSGAGTFAQSGGSFAIARHLSIGDTAGRKGTFDLSGTGQLSVPEVFVGDSGTGVFTQSGGTSTVSGSLYIAYISGSSGTYNLNGGKLVVSAITKGSGASAFNFNGGTLQAGAAFTTGLPIALGTAGSNATIDTAGYNLTLAGSLSGPGNLVKIGPGTLILGAANTFGGWTTVGAGMLNLSHSAALQGSTLVTPTGGASIVFDKSVAGHAFSFGGLSGAEGIVLSDNATTPNPVTLSVGYNNSTTMYSGTISGNGALVKIGTGTLTLTAGSTYNGPTTVNAGSLLVNSPGSLTSPVTVQSNATLGGNGRVGAVTVNAGGHVAPGASASTLTLTGNLTLASGAKLDFELAGPAASDSIAMSSSTLILGGQQFSDFAFTPLPGFGPGTYTLIDAAAITGSLGATRDGTVGGLPATLATSGSDLVLTVVPEPSTLVLLGMGAAGVLELVWRRRKRTV